MSKPKEISMERYPSLEALAASLNVSVRRIQRFQQAGRLTITRNYEAPKKQMDALRARNGKVNQ
jgi:hypothetical protein